MKPNDYSTKLIEAIAQKNAAAVSASILAKGNQKFDDFVKKVDLFYASPKEQRAGDLLFEHEGFTELPKLSKMPKAEERGIVSIDVKKQLAQEVFQSKAAFVSAFQYFPLVRSMSNDTSHEATSIQRPQPERVRGSHCNQSYTTVSRLQHSYGA